MYTQQNVLRVFVSNAPAPVYDDGSTAPGVAISFETFCAGTAYHGKIAAFDAVTNLSIDEAVTADAYIAFNDGGNIKVTEVIPGFTWAIKAYAAETAMIQTLLIPTVVVGDTYQLEVRVLTDNFNGDETKKSSYTAKTGDTAIIVATALVNGIQASLNKDKWKDYTIANGGTATITVTALQQQFKLGRKPGGYTRFNMLLTKPTNVAQGPTTSTPGVVGNGVGRIVLSQEFFARQNSDAVSINEFRTALPIKLNASELKSYNTQEVSNQVKVVDEGGSILVQKHTLVAFQTA